MSRSSLASVQIDVSEEPREIPQQDPDTPFRILVAGDFSGGAGRIRKPIMVDRDNFEDVMRKLNVGVSLDLQGGGEDMASVPGEYVADHGS